MLKKNLSLALLSSFLMWLAWPPSAFFTPLLLVGLVPLFVALNRIILSDESKKGKKIFLTAGFAFFIFNTANVYWIYNAISAYNDTLVALLISFLPFCFGALLMTLAFWLYYQIRKITANIFIQYFSLICFYIGLEYFYQSWDAEFPWMTLGNGFASMHQLVQWYEYTGIYGGSLWILLSNIIAYEAYKKYTSSAIGYAKIRPALLWLLLLFIPIGFSLSKYFSYHEKSCPINVVVAQPNINPYEKMGGLSTQSQLNTLCQLSDSIAQPNTEYFIWPETAIPNYADEASIRSNPEFLDLQKFISKYKNGNLVTGMETLKWYPTKETISAKKHPESGFYYDNFNSAVQIENSAEVQIYHKSKLVPGVEKMPFPAFFNFLSPVFEKLGGTIGGWGWQNEPGVLYSQNGVGVAPVVCYESIWGNWVAQSVKQGAQFIAIITNDGWWGNTAGKDQHFMYAKLRAIENRRWVSRSANTGISGFINQRGDVIQQSKWWTKTALKQDINLNSDLTFYSKNGDFIAKFLSFFAVLISIFILVKVVKKRFF